jgi:hypothetical protein
VGTNQRERGARDPVRSVAFRGREDDERTCSDGARDESKRSGRESESGGDVDDDDDMNT